MAKQKKTMTELVKEMRKLGIVHFGIFVHDYIDCDMETSHTVCDTCGRAVKAIFCDEAEGKTVEEALTKAIKDIERQMEEQLEAESDD